MAFDPDAYLAAKAPPQAATGGFDPDAYLAAKAQPAPQEQAAAPVEHDMLQQTIDALQGFRDIPNATRQIIARIPAPILEAINKSPTAFGAATQVLNVTPETAPNIDREIQQEEQAYQARRAAEGETGVDWSRIGGNIAATAPLAAVMPAATTTGRAMLQGGALGAAQPVTDGGESFWKEKGIQSAVGAATAGIISPFVKWAASVVKPVVDPAIKKLSESGVKMTPGALFGSRSAEAKLTSTPILGKKIVENSKRSVESFNRAAYQQALAPIGAEAPKDVGNAGIAAVRQTLNDAYDDVLKNVKFIPDEQFTSDLALLKKNAAGLAPREKARFLQELGNVESKVSPSGGMAGETYKIVESRLIREAKKFSGSSDAYQQELGGALNELLDTYKRTLARANPAYAERLSNINEGWANYARLRKAASSVAAEDGIFSPEQLLNAVKAEDKTVGKRAFSEGTALMQDLASAGKKVIGKAYPDSGTAGREAIFNPIAWGVGGALSPAYSALNAISEPLLLARPQGAEALSNLLLRAQPGISAGVATASTSARNQLINNR